MVSREEVLAVLKAHEAELRARGVAHVALFGSLARGEARADSDVDLMVDINPSSRIDLWDYVGVMHYLQDLFAISVDVANHETLKPHVRPSAEQDAVYAF
jgi:uncharacterized protein